MRKLHNMVAFLRRHIKVIFVLVFVAAFASCSGFFYLNYKISIQQGRLCRVNRKITKLQETLRNLQAEWSHLNHPRRIARLAQHHLGYQPLHPSQVRTLPKKEPKEDKTPCSSS